LCSGFRLKAIYVLDQSYEMPYLKVRNINRERILRMPSSLITSKGQTTIPKSIRDHLHLQPGDKIDFVVEENGKVVLEPATLDVSDLEGILHRPGMKVVSLEDMKKALGKRFRRK
jgi:antitoxin PrlF